MGAFDHLLLIIIESYIVVIYYISVVVGAFTLPKVYEVNKVQIDRYVDMAQSRFDDYYKQYVYYDSINIVI